MKKIEILDCSRSVFFFWSVFDLSLLLVVFSNSLRTISDFEREWFVLHKITKPLFSKWPRALDPILYLAGIEQDLESIRQKTAGYTVTGQDRTIMGVITPCCSYAAATAYDDKIRSNPHLHNPVLSFASSFLNGPKP